MKKLIFTAILFMFFAFTYAQDFDWVSKAGGNASDQGYAIVTNEDGTSYVTGWFSDTAYFGEQSLVSAGGKDVFVAKYSPEGELIWVVQAPGEGSNTAAGITLDEENNVFITGWFEENIHFGTIELEAYGLYDMFVAKLNADGEFLWANQSFSEQDDYGNRLCINAEGDVIVAGTFRGVVDFGNEFDFESEGDRDIFIANYSNAGVIQWVKQFGGGGEDRAYGIMCDAAANIYFTGFFNGTISFKEMLMYSPAITSIYVAKLNPAGNFLWAKRGFGSANDFARGYSLALDENANIYTTGFFSGSLNLQFQDTLYATGDQFDFDMYLTKYNTDGELQWARNGGGVDMDEGRDVITDAGGYSYVIGFFNSYAEFGNFECESDGMSDIFTAKYNPDGEVEYLLHAGGTLSDYGYGIGLAADSCTFLTGVFTEDAVFGDISIEGWDQHDIFVAKVDPSGTYISYVNGDQLLRIYPNPVDDLFHLQWDQAGDQVEIEILDMTGKLMMHREISWNADQQDVVLDTHILKNGTYVVKATSDNQSLTAKIIIKH